MKTGSDDSLAPAFIDSGYSVFGIYLFLGAILVIGLWSRSQLSKKLGLSFSAMCIRQYPSFLVFAVPFWPTLWLFEYAFVRNQGASKQRQNSIDDPNDKQETASISAKVLAWTVVVFLMLSGIGIASSGRFAGKRAATEVTGSGAVFIGFLFFGIAGYVLYLLGRWRGTDEDK